MSLGAEVGGLQYSNPAWTTHAETVLETKTVSEACPVYSAVSSATESRRKEVS